MLFGPECSGKSTLASALVAHYDGILVSEYLRSYAQDIWDTQKRTVSRQDITHLIDGQFKAQQQALAKAATKAKGSAGTKAIEQTRENTEQESANHTAPAPCPIFLDTNIEQLEVYFTYYFGPNWGQIPMHMRRPKGQVVYLLTRPDIPWEADELRDQPLSRDTLFSIFRTYLDQKGARYVVISGAQQERINQACQFINNTWPNLYVRQS